MLRTKIVIKHSKLSCKLSKVEIPFLSPIFWPYSYFSLYFYFYIFILLFLVPMMKKKILFPY